MGTVVTVMNMKGGVGKTTVAMHLGGVFARFRVQDRSRKVLLIDYDPQFNLSQSLLPAKLVTLHPSARLSEIFAA